MALAYMFGSYNTNSFFIKVRIKRIIRTHYTHSLYALIIRTHYTHSLYALIIRTNRPILDNFRQ